MNTYRKPTRVDFNLTVSEVMDEFWGVAHKYSTPHLGLDIAYDAEWYVHDSRGFCVYV
jgi:hypothetical protein